jgi:molybdenum cofactor cytidylyltransferase
MISAIVLAAGESRRMGETKQLLEWRGSTILGCVLDNLLASPVDEILLVVGYEAERILEMTANPRIKAVFNPDFRQGMSTSLRSGLTAMDVRAEAFLIALADQPGIPPGVVQDLIDHYRESYPEKKIVAPAHLGRRGHPVLFSGDYLDEFLGLTGDVGGREILARHPEEVLLVEAGTDAVLLDVDTPEDYQNLSRRIGL